VFWPRAQAQEGRVTADTKVRSTLRNREEISETTATLDDGDASHALPATQALD